MTYGKGDNFRTDVDGDDNIIGKDIYKDNNINITRNKIIFLSGINTELLKDLLSSSSDLYAINENRIALPRLKSIQQESEQLLDKIDKVNNEHGTEVKTIQTSDGREVSINDLSMKNLILKGNENYYKGSYKDAELCYSQALELDPNNVFCLINLNFLYAEKFAKYEDSVKIMYRLLSIEPGLETKSNLVESLLKVGNYKEARKYALEIINTPEDKHVIFKRDSPLLNVYTLDYTGYQAVNRFFILCSYLLENDVTNGNKELINFLSFYKYLNEDFRIEEKQWVFNGLINTIHEADIDYLIKFVLYNTINLLEGKVGKLTKTGIYAIQFL